VKTWWMAMELSCLSHTTTRANGCRIVPRGMLLQVQNRLPSPVGLGQALKRHTKSETFHATEICISSKTRLKQPSRSRKRFNQIYGELPLVANFCQHWRFSFVSNVTCHQFGCYLSNPLCFVRKACSAELMRMYGIDISCMYAIYNVEVLKAVCLGDFFKQENSYRACGPVILLAGLLKGLLY
jgi:hypothetical protein